MGRVDVQLTESYNSFPSRRVTMRHRRCFSNASVEKILSLLLGLKFCGAGGLMTDSTADSEEDSPDGRNRFIKNFSPLGDSLGSRLAGSFNVRQELIACTQGQHGVVSTIRMSFSPVSPEDEGPCGSFLWKVEPESPNENEERACWTELINTEETRAERLPELRIPTWRRWIFSLGHNRLMHKAAQRIADVLNGDSSLVVFDAGAQALCGAVHDGDQRYK